MAEEKEAPLPEHLRRVPADFRLLISGEGFFPSSTSIPVGALAHAAAEEIECLTAALAALRAELEELKQQRRDWLDNDITARTMKSQEEEIMRLEAEHDAALADAKRLREALLLFMGWYDDDGYHPFREFAAVDAARAALAATEAPNE